MLARLAYHAGHSEPMLPPEGAKPSIVWKNSYGATSMLLLKI